MLIIGQPISVKIIKSKSLNSDNFVQTTYKKSLIVLHHSCGSTAEGTITHWNKDDKKIATAYIIEKDGEILELFEPENWSYHLGIKGSKGRHDKRSIGIEIVNEGPVDNCYGDIYDYGSRWRGYRYFANYTDEQVNSAIELVNYLFDKFEIPRQTPVDHLTYKKELLDFKGVVGHCQLRADKTDPHPGFDWERMARRCGLGEV